MIKGKLLWWRSSVVSGITTLTIQIRPVMWGIGMKGPEIVKKEIPRETWKEFYLKVGNPARKVISYENGRLKLEE